MKKRILQLSALIFSLMSLVSCNGQPVDQESFTHKMFGSWQSFLIQIGATLIMILIVGKFLIKPVREVLKKRQDYVVKQISDAEERKKEAESKNKEADDRILDLNRQAKVIIDEAKKNAEDMKKKASNEIEEEKALQKQLLVKQLEQEKEKAKEEIRKEIVDVALVASSSILKREVNEKDNKKIIDDFIKEVDAND